MNIDIEKWLRRPPVILPGCSPIVAMEAMVSHWDRIDRIEKIKKNREGLAVNYEYLKGSEKDFEGVPVWATHVVNEGNYDAFSEGFDYMSRAIWTTSKGNEFRIGNPGLFSIIAERRPITEPAWSGEGLPPVGTKCEVQTSSNSPWFECEIVYSGESGAAFISTKSNSIGCVDDSCTDFFRPIRSPEDVARDEAIDAIFSILSVNILDGSDSNAGKVFDAIAAGKIPGVKLE